MKPFLRIARPLCLCVVLLFAGCDGWGPKMFLAARDREIKDATQALQTAGNDVQRAAAYVQRGKAYSEKARYSRLLKLIPMTEYERLFALAVKDQDQGLALDPGSAEAYFTLGQTYSDRGGLELLEHKDAQIWFDSAAANFKKSIEKDRRNYLAIDRLGLVYMSTTQYDQAIAVFTQEMALDKLGRTRLADAYCNRASVSQQAQKYDAAIADYENSIEIGSNADGCECEPYNPLVGLYTESRQYDKGWKVAAKALKSGKIVAPELLEKLKKDSGR